jgi:hypothetical protein
MKNNATFTGHLLRTSRCWATALMMAIVAGIGITTPAAAQSSGLPQFEQVALTEEDAKNAMYAYRDLKERYGDEVAPMSETEAMLQGLTIRDDVQATVSSYGFADMADWHRTLLSFIMAHMMGVEGRMADIEAAIAQLQDNDQIPEATKQQMMERFSAMLPSEDNVEIARQVGADPECAALIEDLRN